ncbi:MAG: mannonate dehydratase [Planctomycetaceae bacterium]|nr:mannonate dehydratase [Planctomycetaceae bacterium]
MKLATVLTPPSDSNLRLAAQCGVTEIVARYPGPDLKRLAQQQRHYAGFGLTLSVVEGYLPIENIKIGRDDGSEVAAMKQLIREMGRLRIPLLCYNFMAGTDWVRTQLDAPERGGAKVTAFRLRDAEQAMLLGRHGAVADTDPADGADPADCITADMLWVNLERFLREVLPVAEEAGVVLAMHPDDPPLAEFQRKARIMNRMEGFERLVQLVPSSSNAVCFCQGTFAEMGEDIPAAIRRLGSHIRYVHFRDVRGTAESFAETFHDNGPTDMAAAMQAYADIGFRGPIRPDHVPQLDGEDDGEPGYTIKGRLFAWGYIRGLMHGVQRSTEPM